MAPWAVEIVLVASEPEWAHRARLSPCLAARARKRSGWPLRAGDARLGVELPHFLGQHPERPIEAHATVDAAHLACTNTTTLHTATRLATAQAIFLKLCLAGRYVRAIRVAGDKGSAASTDCQSRSP